MAILNKIFGSSAVKPTIEILEKKAEPVLRFGGGFEKLGVQTRELDTRTPEQIDATIDYLAKRNPAIQEFVKDLKQMSPRHKALASDTIELAGRTEMLMTNVNMNKVSPETNKSLLQHLLSVFPKAEKENPASLDFAQEVINNTDTLTSKYFLASMNGIFSSPEASKHLEAIQPLVKDFAEATLNGGYTGNFEKQNNFVNFIQALLTPEASPEKIKLITKLCKVVDSVPTSENVPICLNRFVTSKTPVHQVVENIEVLPTVLENSLSNGKKIDVVDFVNHNLNLK